MASTTGTNQQDCLPRVNYFQHVFQSDFLIEWDDHPWYEVVGLGICRIGITHGYDKTMMLWKGELVEIYKNFWMLSFRDAGVLGFLDFSGLVVKFSRFPPMGFSL